MPSLAEDMMLLLLDDETGRLATDKAKLDNVIGGALLLELANSGRLSGAQPEDDVKGDRLVVRDSSPTGDAILDDALRQLEKKPLKGKQALDELAVKSTREAVLDGLVQRGVIRQEQSKILGLIPRTSWPANDTEHENSVRERLGTALNGTEKPDEHIGGIISLLYAIDAVTKVADGDSKALNARAKEIAEGDGVFASEAVRDAVQAVRHAVRVAILAGIVTSAAAAGQ